MSDGQVIFDIKGNNKPLKDSLLDSTNAIQNAAKDWDKAADDSGTNISSSLTNAFSRVLKSAAFYKIGKMLVDLGVESVNLASDLQEVQNVVDTTFGAEGSKKIEKWATDAAKNYGITELQAKQYTSTLGAMMKSAGLAGEEIVDMSTAMAGLAADMASFYNLGFDEAFQKSSYPLLYHYYSGDEHYPLWLQFQRRSERHRLCQRCKRKYPRSRQPDKTVQKTERKA